MNVDITKESPNVLSLCTGYGGLERGLESVLGPINVLTHVEIEAYAVANLVNKMETGKMVPAPVWTDLKTFRSGIFRGAVDILTGGYPCQPFSAAGKRMGSEDPRHLWPYVSATIMCCEPRWVFLENVEGHLSKGVVQVLSDLEKMAYRVECGVFSAAEVGAPHQRKRVFILAHREGCGHNGWGSLRDDTDRVPECSEVWRYIRRQAGGCRPGQQQYDWEEPRVVIPKSTERGWACSKDNAGGRIKKIGRSNRADGPNGEIKSGVGRTIDESGSRLDPNRNRIDRLRLLGNGVVPATAAKAFVTLYEAHICKQASYAQTGSICRSGIPGGRPQGVF